MGTTNNNKGCDELSANLLRIEDAKRLILDACTPLRSFERVDIRTALGRVLFQDVQSSINVPAHTNSAMDGYAIRSEDLDGSGETTLTVVATVMAGAPIQTKIKSSQCARIMTGGKMPKGTDTVIMQEHVSVNGNEICITNGHHAGQNVRQAGEDLAIGATVIKHGKLLAPADIGVLASIGLAEVTVHRKLRVAFFSTGDELCGVGETLAEGQIYDSNRYTLYCMLTRLGVDIIDMGIIPDDRQATESAFTTAAQQADVLITSGGVSVGEADYVKETLDKLGNIEFWKIAMKPGKPLAVGKINQCHFFGLPGNPVSAMVTFYQFVTPALIKLSGREYEQPMLLELPCSKPLKKSAGRMEFQRGIIESDNDGKLSVRSTGQQGSGILSSMNKANCFILLPLETSYIEKGSLVKVQSFEGLI